MRAIWRAKAGTTKAAVCAGPVWLNGRIRITRKPVAAMRAKREVGGRLGGGVGVHRRRRRGLVQRRAGAERRAVDLGRGHIQQRAVGRVLDQRLGQRQGAVQVHLPSLRGVAPRRRHRRHGGEMDAGIRAGILHQRAYRRPVGDIKLDLSGAAEQQLGLREGGAQGRDQVNGDKTGGAGDQNAAWRHGGLLPGGRQHRGGGHLHLGAGAVAGEVGLDHFGDHFLERRGRRSSQAAASPWRRRRAAPRPRPAAAGRRRYAT